VPATDPPIDCFYVYPTVSRQTGTNATLKIDPEERAVAVAQAARFSQVCNVYAPMYPQLTAAAIATPESISFAAAVIAYQGVRSAFLDYMANNNHGRGIVFIGHSQGAVHADALFEGRGRPQARNPPAAGLRVASGRHRDGAYRPDRRRRLPANIPACFF